MESTESYPSYESWTELDDTRACDAFDVGVYGVLGFCIITMGIVGNCLTIFIFYKESKVSCRLLTCLAIADELVLIFGGLYIPLTGFLHSFRTATSREGGRRSLISLLRICYIITWIFNHMSAYLTLLITWHRYLSICHPLRVKILCSQKKIALYVSIIVASSVILYTPNFSDIVLTKDSAGRFHVASSSFHETPFMQVLTISQAVLCYVIPVACFYFMGFRIIRGLREQRKKLLTQSSVVRLREQANRGLTLSIIFVISIFVVCQPLGPVSRVLTGIYRPLEEYTKCDHPMYYIMLLPNFMMMINSAINFVIYVCCLKGFRQKLLSLWKRTSVAPLNVDISSQLTDTTNNFRSTSS